MPGPDPNSFSNFDQIQTESIYLNLVVSFAEQSLQAAAVFDTNQLEISGAEVKVDDSWKAADFKLADQHEAFGRALSVALPSGLQAGQKISIQLHYRTLPTAAALQWLRPEQTMGGQHPYLFSQCQAIHARSLLPCQDAPAVKLTYTATIACPAPLTAVMSARRAGNESSGNTGTFHFSQPVPLPSYLIALAVGHLTSREIGPRSAVWSEPEMVEAGAYEFAETEKFLATGESLLGPYVWGRYDILLLPPSFPYGGMENPCLTFVTPTLLAGDRSLADVVIHEIAHSWMGNLVTTRAWRDFWLNEGCTVFSERKIAGRLYGEEFAQLEALIGLEALREAVALFTERGEGRFTRMVPDLAGIDPDDAFSSVPYEKGFNFLYHLQGLTSAPAFEQFLRDWVQHYSYKSASSEDFRAFFTEQFPAAAATVDWHAWFFGEGVPAPPNHFNDTLARTARALAARIKAEPLAVEPAAAEGFFAKQMIILLDSLQDSAMAPAAFAHIGRVLGLDSSNNSELRFRWLQLRLKSRLPGEDYASVVDFLKSNGRMKFVRPMFRALAAADLSVALKTFAELGPAYHSIAAKMIQRDLDAAKAKPEPNYLV